MNWLVIILLILLGSLVFFIELLFFPGITILVLAGCAAMLLGIFLAFGHYGIAAGIFSLLGTIVFNLIIFIIALKSGFWSRFALHDTNKSKVNVIDPELKIGEEGIALSKIGPIGKAQFNDKDYEVQSQGEYINERSKIEIIKIHNNKIFVKTKT